MTTFLINFDLWNYLKKKKHSILGTKTFEFILIIWVELTKFPFEDISRWKRWSSYIQLKKESCTYIISCHYDGQWATWHTIKFKRSQANLVNLQCGSGINLAFISIFFFNKSICLLCIFGINSKSFTILLVKFHQK